MKTYFKYNVFLCKIGVLEERDLWKLLKFKLIKTTAENIIYVRTSSKISYIR